MTQRMSRGCFGAASNTCLPVHFAPRYHTPFSQTLRSQNYRRASGKAESDIASRDYSPKSALTAIETKSKVDLINPPRSVLPPLLELPIRNSQDNVFLYLFRLGKAYGSFYKNGIKAVWYNNKACRALREQKTKELAISDVKTAAQKLLITRAEWQLLARNSHDIGKLPFFGLLVVIFGEWLPLLVPFMPAVVPGTCRIPKQITGMRNSAEQRRRRCFRLGVAEPSADQIKSAIEKGTEWATTKESYLANMLGTLKHDQLYHMSASLNLHNRLWDFFQVKPPITLLRTNLTKRIQYLALDDKLLLHHGGRKPVGRLVVDELAIACQERGIDVLGKRDDVLKHELDNWLGNQRLDGGGGRALLVMLFRR